MRIKADDLTLLYRIHDCLLMCGEKNEVAALNQSIAWNAKGIDAEQNKIERADMYGIRRTIRTKVNT